MAWRIQVYQIQVVDSPLIGTYNHNFIVIRDDNGNRQYEFNGGPVDLNGNFIRLSPGFFSINSRLNGVVGVDVRRSTDPPLFAADPDARLVQETLVSQDDA